jgi:drug/metabolite transporter (DMT)-like permease
VLGSGAVVLLSIVALTGTTATNRSLFQSMYPVATAIAARALLGERLRLSAYGLIVIMTLGLFLMNTNESRLVFGRSFWLLAATLPLIGLSDVYAKRTLRDTEPSFVAAGRLVFGACLLLAAVPWIPIDDWRSLSGLLPWVVASGLAMAGGALGLYRAMDTVGASLAAAFAGLAPLVTVTAEWLFLETSFGTLQLSGLALVAAGGAALARRI